MSEYTKGELEFLESLMSAWVAGWYSGRNCDTNDDKKRTDCPIIMDRFPKFASAPLMYEALKKAEQLMESMLVPMGIKKEGSRPNNVLKIMQQAIAAAEGKN